VLRISAAFPKTSIVPASGAYRPVELRHQRALARAVLADERVHRPRLDDEVHRFVRPHGPEALVDVGHPDGGFAHAQAGPVDSRRMSSGVTTMSRSLHERPADAVDQHGRSLLADRADRIADGRERRIGEGPPSSMPSKPTTERRRGTAEPLLGRARSAPIGEEGRCSRRSRSTFARSTAAA
jgi:hypothetical protein